MVEIPHQARCRAWRRTPGLDAPLPCEEADRAALRRAYGLTQQAQAHLFPSEALALEP